MMTYLCCLLIFMATAFGEDNEIDRFSQQSVNKDCGPVPWEAFAASNYAKAKSLDVAVDLRASYDPTTAGMDGSGSLDAGRVVSHKGDNYELPMTGEQWVTMYLLYMGCIVRTDSPDLFDTQGWKEMLDRKIIKTPSDVTSVMESYDALKNPISEKMLAEFKKLLDKTPDVDRKEFDSAVAKVDNLYAQTAELRKRIVAIEADNLALHQSVEKLQGQFTALETENAELHKSVETLQSQFDTVQETLDSQEKLDKKETEELKGRMDKLEGLVEKMSSTPETVPVSITPPEQ